MSKNYFFKIILLLLLFCHFFNKASAQYATSGTAGSSLTNSVYWLTWDNATLSPTSPTNINSGQITNGTYQWLFSPTVRITADVTGLTFNTTIPQLTPYTAGSYYADGLNQMFTANGQTGSAARAVPNSGISVLSGSATFNIKLKVELLINSSWTEVNYPGIVVGDAESIDIGDPSGGIDPGDNNYYTNREYIQATSPSSIEWQVLSAIWPSYPNPPDAQAQHYRFVKSHTATTQTFKIQVERTGISNAGVQAVMYARGVKELDNVTMKGTGTTALAIGFVIPFDLGDNPSTYGTAGSYIDDFDEVDQTPGDGDFAVATYTPVALTPKARVYIGANNVDADGQPMFSAASNSDDDIASQDEGTLTPPTLAELKVNQNNDFSVTLPVTNAESAAATLFGWIDFNGDGLFGIDELITAAIPAGTNNQNFTLTYPNAMFASKIKAGLLYARFRITTSSLIDNPATTQDERSINYAANGETEDYKFKDILGVNISGKVVNDGNGASGGITGAGIQSVAGIQLHAYLLDAANKIINTAAVNTDGTYTLGNNNNGNYTVTISTNNLAIGATFTTVGLPSSWASSGETYGTNNVAGSGTESGVPDSKIAVSTPGTSLDIANVNFGLNQGPVTVADNTTTSVGQSVVINVPGNDSDVDGTLDLTSVLLIDPADANKKTTVTVANQGTYTVSANGKVTFSPLSTYTGNATSIPYTIKDDFGTESTSALITVSIKPSGVDDIDNTSINTSKTTNVKANDVNAGTGSTVTNLTPVNPSTDGAIAIADATAGTVKFTPATGFTGTYKYTYILTSADGTQSSAPVNVSIIVKPAGVDDSDNTTIGTAKTTNIKANDLSAGIAATITNLTPINPPTSGTVAIVDALAGTVQFTPANSFIGIYKYTYTLTSADGTQTSAPINASIDVKPVGQPDQDPTPVNTPVTTPVTANDGISGTSAVVTAGPHPANGTIAVNPTGTITYAPNNNYVGIDTYTYTLTKNGETSAPITVTISIKPTGVNDNVTTPINTAKTTTVTANDGAIAVSATVAAGSTAPVHGSIVVNNDGTITYTPVNNYAGIDSYTYILTKNGATSDQITVTINIKPVGVIDNVVTAINTAINTTVTSNDGPSGVNAIVTAGTTSPSHGSILINSNGTITYTPANNYIGTDTYTYTLTKNGAISDQVMVNVTIDYKPIGVNDNTTTPINTATTTTVTSNDGQSGVSATVTAVPTSTNGGEIVTNSDQTITYTPPTDYVGTDTYTYTLSKNGTVSDPITVTINVKPVGITDNVTTLINIPVTTTVTVNDGTSGTNATVNSGTLPGHGNITVNNNGTITYTPANNYIGTDTYTYTLTKNGLTSNPVTVNVNITAIQPPVANNDNAGTTQNTPVIINILSNDTKGSNNINSTSVTVVQQPQHGTVSIDASGNAVYTPANNYYGSDTFTYTVNATDGSISNVASVSVNISAKPIIGLAKSLVSSIKAVNGTYNITYLLTVGNYGVTSLNDLSITDDLSQTFEGATPKLVSIKSLGSLTVNSNYNGTTIAEMLQAGNTLAAGSSAQIQIVVNVTLISGGTYLNSAKATGTDPSGTITTDLSTDGTKPDPTIAGDVSPSTPTPVQLLKSKEFIPGGFSPNGDGVNDMFVIENSGNRQVNLEVYNRWGNRVYKNANYKNDWDGKSTEGVHTGGYVTDGTYFYIVSFDNTDRRQGYITIHR